MPDLPFYTLIGEISKYENFWFTVVFCPLGFLLNVMSIVVFSRKCFWDMSMGFYNIVLACVNNSYIVCMCWLFLPPYYSLNPLTSAQISCKLLNYLQRVFSRQSSFVDMMIVVDRMVCISFPNKFLFMKNKKCLAAIIAGLFVISLATCSEYFEYTLVNAVASNSNSNLTNTTTNQTWVMLKN